MQYGKKDWRSVCFWTELDEAVEEFATVCARIEHLALEARVALRQLPALAENFENYLAKKLIICESILRQLVLDLKGQEVEEEEVMPVADQDRGPGA